MLFLFQSTRPIRGATGVVPLAGDSKAISIHAPHTGRDAGPGGQALRAKNFNPRAPYGARLCRSAWTSALRDFNPRAPYGARPGPGGQALRAKRFQSTRPIRGATRYPEPVPEPQRISIHAPHTGRDGSVGIRIPGSVNFNPRAPYGARLYSNHVRQRGRGFQSTRPIRGATAQ